MRSAAVIFAVMCGVALLACVDARTKLPSCIKARDPARPFTTVVKSPVPTITASTPAAWDWRNVSGESFLSSSRNQHIPQYCGACWAMATTSSLADRIRIAKNNQGPDVMIAVQSVLHCVPDGCGGGDLLEAYYWMYTNGVPTDTCQNYVAIGTGYECTNEHICMNCNPDGNCSAVLDYPKFGISEFGGLNGVDAMKAEIAARGPIACQIAADPIYDWGFGPNKTQVFTAGVGFDTLDHVISVVGYGHDDAQGLDYWVIRNSWGEYWGVSGFFRLQMGNNQLGIESNDCGWAVPIV